MSETKFRRKTFLATLGAVALGAVGLRGATTRSEVKAGAPRGAGKDRVVKEPRAVPCSGREL